LPGVVERERGEIVVLGALLVTLVELLGCQAGVDLGRVAPQDAVQALARRSPLGTGPFFAEEEGMARAVDPPIVYVLDSPWRACSYTFS
jgi:hypothetical protein